MRNLLVVLVLVVICAACGCSRRAFVPVAAVSERSAEASTHSGDTVVWRDTVTVERVGDTVRERRVVWRDRRVVVRDTVRVSQRDTVTVAVPSVSGGSRIGRVADAAEMSLRVGVAALLSVAFVCGCWRLWRRLRP